jgi:acyl-CoA dehydrogenase
MSDQSFLNWPFFEDKHRVLALELENWAKSELTEYSSAPANVDLACQELVQKLADEAGWIIV